MNKERALLWVAIISVGAVLGAGETQPAQESTQQARAPIDAAFQKRLNEVDAAMAKVTDLRADFEQRRKTPLLKRPLVSKGTVVTRGERVRWDTTSPRLSTMVIGGGEIRMYYPSDRLLEVYPIGAGFKDIAGAPLPRLSLLKERFELAPIPVKDLGGDEKNDRLVAVRMTPRGDDLKKHVTSVRVLIDTAKPAATKVVMTDPEGEETEIAFSNVRLNSGVKDADVELKVPEGVRVSRPLGETARSAPKPAEPEKKP
ncbi:MAG TPA: outer membrane lipoprotein carrier protein LolA [Phycisphaerales bacterium]|nr:outer membrane lipoprotein carrier protein LolA [Phycisphaerales bacterium]